MGTDIYRTKSTLTTNPYTFVTVKTSLTGVDNSHISDKVASTGTFHTTVNDRFLNQPPYPSGW